MKSKILTIIGARPQFIKAAPVSMHIDKLGLDEIIVNTGQHYDYNMSDIFFSEFDFPNIKYNLEVGSGSHGSQTGEMLKRLDPIIELESPDIVLVYGDTNSTLAGAIAASKFNIPIAHIESGLRSYNRTMPEEINRVLTDNLSSLLFCPSLLSKENLSKEGIDTGVYVVGDVMYDIFSKYQDKIPLDNKYGEYCFLTLHRAENTTRDALIRRVEQIENLDMRIVFPMHPRTREAIKRYNINIPSSVTVIDPAGWLQTMSLIKSSSFVVTDSGGLQKEVFWNNKFCFTLREETEWVETLDQKMNILVGLDNEIDISEINSHIAKNPYGDGKASEKIVSILSD